MFRIDTPTATGTQPAIEPAGTPGYFKNAVPGVSDATKLDESFFNNLQEEMINLLSVGNGLGVTPTVPDKGSQSQAKEQIEKAIVEQSNVNRELSKNISLHLSIMRKMEKGQDIQNRMLEELGSAIRTLTDKIKKLK